MGGCVAVDRNDKIKEIEKRHNSVFYFNYPETIQTVKRNIQEAKLPLTENAKAYFKFCMQNLQREI
jgi:hypothetical protein